MTFPSFRTPPLAHPQGPETYNSENIPLSSLQHVPEYPVSGPSHRPQNERGSFNRLIQQPPHYVQSPTDPRTNADLSTKKVNFLSNKKSSVQSQRKQNLAVGCCGVALIGAGAALCMGVPPAGIALICAGAIIAGMNFFIAVKQTQFLSQINAQLKEVSVQEKRISNFEP